MRILIALATVLLVSGSAHAARQSDAPAVTYIAGNLLGVDLETPATLDFDTPGFAGGGFGTGKGVRVAIGTFTFFLPYASVTEAYLTPPPDPKLQDKVSRLTFRFSNEAEEEKAVTFELPKNNAQRGLANLRGYLPQLDGLPEVEDVSPVPAPVRERTPAVLPPARPTEQVKLVTPLIDASLAAGPAVALAKLPDAPLLTSTTLPAFQRTRVAATLPEARPTEHVQLVTPLLTQPESATQPPATVPDAWLMASVRLPEPAAIQLRPVVTSPSVSKIEAKANKKTSPRLLARSEKRMALKPKPVPEPVAAQPSKPEEWWGDRYWKTSRNVKDWSDKDSKRP